MEIYDEAELSELELERQKNIIKNHEFMKSCGLKVKPLVYVRRAKVDLEKLYAYCSSDETDDEDGEWGVCSKDKKERNARFVPDFKRKVKNPVKFLENMKTKLVVTKSKSTSSLNKKVEKKKENEVAVVVRPQRAQRVNYRENSVPDDDDFIFCEQCNDLILGECTIHSYAYVDKSTCDNNNVKALATLPDGLEIRESLIPNAGLGVFTTRTFDVGVRFGPYQGKKVRKDIPKDHVDTSYMWEIMKDGLVAYYVNGKDESEGNWMRYINCSRAECEQNLVALQFQTEIYYRTYKKMKPGQELLVWYGEEYAKELGISLLEDDCSSEKEESIECIDPLKCDTITHTKEKTRHIKKNTGNEEKPFPCTVCEYKCSYPSVLKIHMRIHTGEKPFACTVCEFKCTQSSRLKIHMMKHTKEKPFPCTVCEYKCSYPSVLKIHMKKHTGNEEKPFACTVCEYKCSRSSSLKIHMMKHTGEKPFACTVCEFKCSRSSILKIHMMTHNDDKPYSCTVCGYKCSSNLKRHMITHTKETPFACTVCEYKSSRSSHLKRHMIKHTKEKPFACTFCEYKCSRSTPLKHHMLKHTGDKLYSCTLCEYKGKLPSVLETHMRTHTKQNPFACTVCEYKSNYSNNLKRHMIRMHTNK